MLSGTEFAFAEEIAVFVETFTLFGIKIVLL